MIHQKIKNKLENFLESAEKEIGLIQVLEGLSETQESLTKRLFTIANTLNPNEPSATFRLVERTKNSISSEIESAIRKARFSQITRASENIKESINPLPSLDSTYGISQKIDNFVESLDNHLHAPNFDSCISLTSSASELLKTLNEVKTLYFVSEQRKNKNHSNPSLTIYIPGDTDLDAFSQKLSAISSIIESCCHLLGLSTSEGEVEIGKIESGSLFAEISANPLVVALATIIISKGTDYIFNKITPTNKNETLKESSENLEKILGIRDFLEKNNFNTLELDDQIKKSSVLLAKKLNLLIDGQNEIEINEKKIQLGLHASLTNKKNSSIEDKSKETE